MQAPVETATAVDELRLYGKAEVAERALLSVRSVELHANNPRCPLKWTHEPGKRRACDAGTLRAYLDWLRGPAILRR